jgi:hypothetical protein
VGLKSVDEVNHTFACTAIVKNEWRYTSATSACALIAGTGRNLFLSVCETTHSSPFSTKDKNAWSITSALAVHFCGVNS